MTLLAAGSAQADNKQTRKLIRKGNSLYRLDNRKDAQVNYYKAWRADTTDARALYNLSTSMLPREWKNTQQAQRDTMALYFKAAAENEENRYRKAKAYHNMGVIFQSAQQFDKAIDAYKNALRNNPNDDETRYNLVLCQRQLKNGGGKGDNSQQPPEPQEQQEQQQKQDQQQQNQSQEAPMDKENAEQLLNAAIQQEKQTQQRLQEQQQQPRRRRIEKNW